MIKSIKNIDDSPNDIFDDGELDQYIKPKVNDREGAPSLKGVKITDLTKNKPGSRFWKSLKLTLAGQTTVGLIGREIKNVAKHFVPFGKYADAGLDMIGDSLKTERTQKPILHKILSVKNFINLKDENGNFDWSELGASILQLVLAGAIVWGAQELGILEAFLQLLEQSE